MVTRTGLVVMEHTMYGILDSVAPQWLHIEESDARNASSLLPRKIRSFLLREYVHLGQFLTTSLNVL